jgi:hypothetical protein
MIGGLVVVAPALDVSRIVATNDQMVAVGVNLLVAQRDDREPIDAALCDALRSRPGVLAAGGATSSKRVVSAVDSGLSFDLVQATPGYAAVIWPDLQGLPEANHGLAGHRVAEQLGVADGAGVPYVWGATTGFVEAAAAPGQARAADHTNSIVVPVAPVGSVVQCFVEAEPGARAALEQLLLGWFDQPANMLVTPLVTALSFGADPDTQLTNRFSRWIPLAAALVLAAFTTALWLSRRTEVGLYGLLGLRGVALTVMVTTDYVLTVVTPVFAGALAAIVYLAPQLNGMVLTVTLIDCARMAALLPLLPLFQTALLKLVKPFDAIRGR